MGSHDTYEIVDVNHKLKFRQGLDGEGVYKLEVEIPVELSILGKWTAEWSYEYRGARKEPFHLTPVTKLAVDAHVVEDLGLSTSSSSTPNWQFQTTWALLKDGKQLNTVFFVPDHEDPAPRVECALKLNDLAQTIVPGKVGYPQTQPQSQTEIVAFLSGLGVSPVAPGAEAEAEELRKIFGWTEIFAKQVLTGNLRPGTVLRLPPVGLDKPPTTVRMSRATAKPTDDIGLWMMIKTNSDNLSWKNYCKAMDMILKCDGKDDDYAVEVKSLASRRSMPFTDTDSYRALKVATEAFLFVNAPTVIDAQAANDPAYLERRGFNVQEVRSVASYPDNWVIPYLQKVADNLDGTAAGAQALAALGNFHKAKALSASECSSDKPLGCWGSASSAKLNQPLLIELIWSYWMEEMQLEQTMHAISRRFQNVHAIGVRDPLAQLEADVLRPLGNLLWGHVQDEQHRLTLARRAYEYSHHYGLALIGKAVPQLRPADNRSKFIEAFHNLLSLCAQFFRQADDTTVVADGFPVLNALREVHLLLSEGAGNQFRDLPATARVEMMMEQWMLAQPEFREFLPRRVSIAYPEDWMHSVDSMRRLQGWGDTNVLHFWHLATCGERVVASIRWGDWNEVVEPEKAANWATFFRPDIQSYIHAYRAVTGVDITVEPVDSTMPSVHLYRRQAAGMLKRA